MNKAGSSIADWLLDPSGLTPHGFCLLWEPWLIWTHALSNVAIGLAYFSIPVVLLRFMRKRRDLVFKPVFALFAAFKTDGGLASALRHQHRPEGIGSDHGARRTSTASSVGGASRRSGAAEGVRVGTGAAAGR